MILQIYADYNKRLGAYKITYVLQRDYGINISVGRVYHVISFDFMRMPTDLITFAVINITMDAARGVA